MAVKSDRRGEAEGRAKTINVLFIALKGQRSASIVTCPQEGRFAAARGRSRSQRSFAEPERCLWSRALNLHPPFQPL